MENTLYYGDNLDILRRYVKDETVDLVYLDPPFKSNQDYNVLFAEQNGSRAAAQIMAFEDTWHWDEAAARAYEETVLAGGKVADVMKAFQTFLGGNDMLAYLSMMAPRLVELRRVLKPTGSIYLHCDPTASHYLKLLMDAVFGPQNFRNEITWKRTSAHSDPKRYGANVDILLFYSRSEKWTWNQLYTPHDPEYVACFRHKDSDGRLWSDYDLTAKGLTGGGYEYVYKGVKSLWRCPQATMRKHDKEGRLHFTKAGGIRLKRYLENMEGVVLQCLWDDIPPINSQASERLGYPTQKPEALLERIIKASSNEGDVVLDPFCGCGTAVAVAQKLNRKWLGIDITHLAITLIKKRLKDQFDAVSLAAGSRPPKEGRQEPTRRDDDETLAAGSRPPKEGRQEPARRDDDETLAAGSRPPKRDRQEPAPRDDDETLAAGSRPPKEGRQEPAPRGDPALSYRVIGEPVALEDARELADKDKYQFQWWALGLVDARPVEQKKGADQGIDGRRYFIDGKDRHTESIIFSVKGGHVEREMISQLHGVVEREKAAVGVFITLNDPTKPMKKEAADAGFYHSDWLDTKHPRLQIVTIEELLEGKEIDLPRTAFMPASDATFKKAPKTKRAGKKNEDLDLD